MNTQRLAFLVACLIGVLGIVWVRAGADPQKPSPDDKSEIAKLRDELKDLKDSLEQFQKNDAARWDKNIYHLARTSPPVGTAVAFAGAWPPKKGEGGIWTEEDLGWMLCDGRPWNHQTLKNIPPDALKELRQVLGKEGLPDYRGYFLRGVDASIDGKSTSGRDEGGIRAVGKEQGYATGRPTGDQPFVTDTTGGHKHTFQLVADASGENTKKDKWYVINRPDLNDRLKTFDTSQDGAHAHTVTKGGDKETRPQNVAVYWIIKFK